MTLAEMVEQYLRVHQAAPATIEKLRWLLRKATAAFGDVRLADLRADEICAWRGELPEGHRFEATQALRQVLNAAVAWQLLDVNPARRGVANPLRRFPEKRPFESWDEIRAVAAQLGPVAGPMVVFGAATGLRPAELVALERRDVHRAGGVVYVRRQLGRQALRPPRPRRPRARRRAPRRLRVRDRGVDAKWTPGMATETRTGTAITPPLNRRVRSGGRLVDVAAPKPRLHRKRKRRKSRSFDEAL
jgi:integrase